MANQAKFQIAVWANDVWASKLDSLKKGAAQRDRDIQEALLQAMAHAQKHGDVTRMVQLRTHGFGNTERKDAAMMWVAMFSPIVIKVEKGSIKGRLKKKEEEGYRPFDLEGASERPFWTFESLKENVKTELSIAALLKMLEAKAKKLKAVNEDPDKFNVLDDVGYQALAIENAIKAIQKTKKPKLVVVAEDKEKEGEQQKKAA